MKILYHHRTGSKDGQSVHIDAIVEALKALGHELVVVSPGVLNKAELGAESRAIVVLKRWLPRRVYEWMELFWSIREFVRLWRVFRHERPDAFYERYNLFLLAGVLLKRVTGVPMLLEVNAPLADERLRFGGLANRRLAAWVERITWRAADRVLPVTEALASCVRARGVDPSRITVIQNGVGHEFLGVVADGAEVRRRHALVGKIVLGFTGFVREWHGLERVIDFIATCDRARRLHFVLVGDGPARSFLEQRAKERGVADCVTITGVVPRGEVPHYVAVFDIALQPHVVPYASPLKVFEYMALSRAIVAPATSNIREVLVHEHSALLFDSADGHAFASAIERLCSDPSLRVRLGHAARATIDTMNLTWTGNAERIVRIFEEMIAGRRRRALIGHETGDHQAKAIDTTILRHH